jgi:hypothetical protein
MDLETAQRGDGQNPGEDLVALMARAGCYQINLGIESLSDAPDRDKEIDVLRIREIARWCRVRGLQLQGLFISVAQ